MQVRSAADSAKKFVTRASAAQNDYAAGVSGAGGKWQAGAEASEEAWGQGTQEAINAKRFGKGVRKAGAAKYQANAVKLGPSRFAQGVQNAEQAYNAGVQPFLSAIGSAAYPARGSRNSPLNLQRVQFHMDLMRKTKLEQLGG